MQFVALQCILHKLLHFDFIAKLSNRRPCLSSLRLKFELYFTQNSGKKNRKHNLYDASRPSYSLFPNENAGQSEVVDIETTIELPTNKRRKMFDLCCQH